MEMTTQYVVIERTSTHSIPLNPIEKIDELCRSKEVVVTKGELM
jgi:hypothetical protein